MIYELWLQKQAKRERSEEIMNDFSVENYLKLHLYINGFKYLNSIIVTSFRE